MKKSFPLMLLFLVVLGLIPSASAGSSSSQEVEAGFEITEVDWRPPNVQAGQEMYAIATFRIGSGSEPAAVLAGEGEEVLGQIRALTEEERPKPVASCREQAIGALDLAGDEESTFSCSLTIPVEGSYSLEALLLSGTGRPLSNSFTAGVEVAPFETALPTELAALFAGLGLFAAVMLVMALGTEVVIDSAKVAFGLKTKVTSVDALEQMERLLPGQLASLGAGAEAQDQVRLLVTNLRETIKPVQTGSQVIQSIREGEYAAAFDRIESAIPDDVKNQVRGVTGEELAKLKKEAASQLEDVFEQMTGSEGLDLDRRSRDELWKAIGESIEKLSVSSLERLFTGWASDLVEVWLRNRRSQLAISAKSEFLKPFENELKPRLKALGLSDQWIEESQSKIEATLSSLDAKALRATDAYLNGLRNLLDTVEQRRFEMASPARKLWRRLRQADAVSGTISALALLWIVFSVIARPSLTIARLETGRFWLDWLLSIAIGILIAGLVMGIPWLAGGLVCVYEKIGLITDQRKLRQSLRELPQALRNNKPLALVEISWNWLLGRALDPELLDQAHSFEEMIGTKLSLETLAQVIMARSDQQRDEESTRVRWMRILSLGTGIALAYLLQIDAAVMLDQALPGISSTVNRLFSVDGAELHNFWNVLPTTLDFSAGMLLTGMAASAGSKFWHDFLGRIQSTRETAETAAQVLKEAQGLSGADDR